MKKQFFRVKQLADQTFLKAEKSEILNHEELQTADHKIEYLRGAISAVAKKIAPSGPTNDLEKLMRKTLEYQFGTTFLDESRQQRDCPLFQGVLKDSGQIEQQLARDFAEHELKVEEMVFSPLQNVLENEFPNILKLKHNLRKYCLDKDSASNRYHSTGKETLKEDMEEADTKVEQSRDALATEMFNLLAKENEFSEYILQLLKLQRSYHESALKNLQNLIPLLEKQIGDSPVRRVFGTSLGEHLRITKKRIAYPLEICITALSEYGLQEEGLFRVAASTIKVKRLKSSIDSGCFSYLIPEYRDVHILASLLKLYLRELPEPLLTYHLHKEWIESMQIPENQRLDVVKNIINKLPRENKENLNYLFKFLSKLTKHPENKMSPSNVAIVLSPNLLWDKHESLNVNIGNCVTINTLIEMFIKEVDVLFPDDVSKLVTLQNLFHDEENYKSSNTNLSLSAESPKPNTRKKKSAPVPPANVFIKIDDDQQKMMVQPTVNMNHPTSPSSGGQSHSNSNKNGEKVTILRTMEVPKALPVEVVKNVATTKDNVTQTPHKPIVVNAKTDRAIMTENVININKSQQHQQQPSCTPLKSTEQKYITNAVHKVVGQQNVQSVIPDNKNTTISKSLIDGIDENQIRRKDPSLKPEIPARPSSLSVLKPSQDVDGLFKRTQCSVYNVANKQQPSFINIQSKNEVYQPGHDTQITEKEKFLGHKPEAAPRESLLAGGMHASNTLDRRPHRTDSNASKKPPIYQREIIPAIPVAVNDNDTKVTVAPGTKSNEQLNATSSSDQQLLMHCDNSSQKTRNHTRARSDGGMIDLLDNKNSSNNMVSLQLAPRNLNKPTQPPPPPPAV